MVEGKNNRNPGVKAKLLIIDDQTILRDGLRMLLEGDPGIEVVGAVSDAAEAVRCIEATKADLVLIDVSMRSMDGLGALRQIKRRSPSIRALVLTANDGEEHLRAALQAGADGYLLKESSRAELLIAIRGVLEGKRFISPAVSAYIVTRYFEGGTPDARHTPFDTLTTREKQVLKLIAEGRRNREIAKYLFISVKTVEKHRSNLMHKTNLHNTAALTSLAMEKGLVGNPLAVSPHSPALPPLPNTAEPPK
jgi:two-component system, NarL family, response regulator NreC